MSIENYGYRHQIINEKGIPARITAVHRDFFEVICEEGRTLARLKTAEYQNKNYPCTGDFVLLDWQTQGQSLIIKTLPRKTYFSRLDPSSSGHKEQAIAANFDYVFIMQALDRDFNLHRLERYLTLAWQSGAIPVVILSKADIVEDYSTHILAVETLAVGVDILAISTKTGFGIAQLASYMQAGKTIVFLGSSGVGKSSLVNCLAGEELMPTQDIRQKDGRGKHTTSHRQLFMLKNGAMLIDTPGMRELGMWDVSQGLEQSFADVEQYFGLCKFKDCKHQSEPHCAVKEAIKSGELSQERWESYQKLKIEARFCEDKSGYLREKEQWHKEISKFQKEQKTKSSNYRLEACTESFSCAVCGTLITPDNAGTKHRNHCPACLSSLHVDNKTGDRASLCKGAMDPISVWVKKDGEWAIIHRCRSCGELSSNRIAADDNPALLMSIAMQALANPPFPLAQLGKNSLKD